MMSMQPVQVVAAQPAIVAQPQTVQQLLRPGAVAVQSAAAGTGGAVQAQAGAAASSDVSLNMMVPFKFKLDFDIPQKMKAQTAPEDEKLLDLEMKPETEKLLDLEQGDQCTDIGKSCDSDKECCYASDTLCWKGECCISMLSACKNTSECCKGSCRPLQGKGDDVCCLTEGIICCSNEECCSGKCVMEGKSGVLICAGNNWSSGDRISISSEAQKVIDEKGDQSTHN